MEATLDQTADRNYTEFHRYAKLYPIPEYVKQASRQDTFQPVGLESGAYADPRNPRQFPCQSKAATYVSYLYFLEHQSELSPSVSGKIQERLDKYADYHGIRGQITELTVKHASLHADTLGNLPDSAFAYVFATDDGHKDRRYPLRNGLEVKAAAQWLRDYRDAFGFADRQVMAEKILEKAAQFGAQLGELDDLLERQAGHGFCDPKKAAAMIRNRVRSVDTIQGLKEGFNKLAQLVEKSPQLAVNNESLLQLAGALDKFDRIAHVKYSAATPRPEDVLFEVTFKSASDLVDRTCTTTTGSVYELSQFEKLALADVQELFGADVCQAVAAGLRVDPVKMAEVASTFPRPDAERLDQLMDESGQSPVLKLASQKIGYSFAELQALAQ